MRCDANRAPGGPASADRERRGQEVGRMRYEALIADDQMRHRDELCTPGAIQARRGVVGQTINGVAQGHPYPRGRAVRVPQHYTSQVSAGQAHGGRQDDLPNQER